MTVRFFLRRPDGFGEYRDKYGIKCLTETVDRWYFGNGDKDDMYYLKQDIVGLPVVVEAR